MAKTVLDEDIAAFRRELIEKATRAGRTGATGQKGGPGSGNWAHTSHTRIGQVGGSDPGGGLGTIGAGPETTPEQRRQASTTHKLLQWYGADYATAGSGQCVRQRIATNTALLERLGRPPEEGKRTDARQDVGRTLGRWQESSNDNDMRSLGIQVAASEEFGAPLSEFTKQRIANVERQRQEVVDSLIGGNPPGFGRIETEADALRYLASERLGSGFATLDDHYKSGLTQREILRAAYDHTQAELQRAGFKPGDTVTVYRGVSLPPEQVETLQAGAQQSIIGNTLESWSVGKDVAGGFVRMEVARTLRQSGGAVLRLDVPMENIVSTGKTGLGSYTEGEIVVIGSRPYEATVEFAGMWADWEEQGWFRS